MQNYWFLIIFAFICFGCQKNSAPEEIVRIVPGKSLMEQVAPTLQRQKNNNSKIYLIQDSVSPDQIDKYIKSSNQKKNISKYQPLYISGKKSNEKKALKEQMNQLNQKIQNKKVGK